MSNTLENIYINAYNALYYKNLRIILVFVQNNIEFDRSVCALFCDFHVIEDIISEIKESPLGYDRQIQTL